MIEMILKQVAIGELEGYWPVVETMLQDEPETWNRIDTLESIQYGLVMGVRDLWFLLEGRELQMAVISQVIRRPAGNAFQIIWAKGQGAKDAVVLMDAAERVADLKGCQWVEVLGQPGWLRLLKPYGYYMDFQVYVKPVVSRRTN